MKYSEISSKTNDELKKIYLENKKEIFNLNVLFVNNELKDTSKIKLLRRNNARILTKLNEKENA